MVKKQLTKSVQRIRESVKHLYITNSIHRNNDLMAEYLSDFAPVYGIMVSQHQSNGEMNEVKIKLGEPYDTKISSW